MIEDVEGLSYVTKDCNAKAGLTMADYNYIEEVLPLRNETLLVDRIDEFSTTYPPRAIDSSLEIAAVIRPVIEEVNPMYLEAPSDLEQIESMSNVLSETDGLKFENWKELDLHERVEVLNELECKFAEIEHRPACPIKSVPLGPITISEGRASGVMGRYRPESKDITINAELISATSPITIRETIDTLIHEGRHAYQDYNINVREVHPRHAEVESWTETMGDGKWEYWSDCSTKIGLRLYEQQSIEIDARSFAADVLNKYDRKEMI